MHFRTENDLKAFYEAHYQAAVLQAFRIVNDIPAAEDIAQECIVKLWHKRNDISAEGNLLHYFRRMVRNRSIDILRRTIPRDDAAELATLETEEHDHVELSELKRSIDEIIDGLPEKCRQIFVLSRFENMTYKDISEQLDISPKTVENQISRALKVLRTGLGYPLFLIFL